MTREHVNEVIDYLKLFSYDFYHVIVGIRFVSSFTSLKGAFNQRSMFT